MPGKAVRIEPGARVNNGQVLFTIADTQKALGIAKVDEVDVNRIQINQAVEIDGTHSLVIRCGGGLSP